MASASSQTGAPKQPAWFIPRLEKLNPRMQELLEARGFAPSETLPHVQEVRDQAWESVKYPCIGDFIFTLLEMPNQDCYERVLARLRTPSEQRLFDYGCGMGQELRNLASSGVAEERLFGLDLNAAMIEFGHNLFHDKDSFKGRLLVGDMLDITTFPADLLGTMDVVFAGLSIHLFNWENQVTAVCNAAALMKQRPGSLLFGWNLGRTKHRIMPFSKLLDEDVLCHDVGSFQRLIKAVEEKTGAKFRVDAKLYDLPEESNMAKLDVEFRVLRFEVEMVTPSNR